MDRTKSLYLSGVLIFIILVFKNIDQIWVDNTVKNPESISYFGENGLNYIDEHTCKEVPNNFANPLKFRENRIFPVVLFHDYEGSCDFCFLELSKRLSKLKKRFPLSFIDSSFSDGSTKEKSNLLRQLRDVPCLKEASPSIILIDAQGYARKIAKLKSDAPSRSSLDKTIKKLSSVLESASDGKRR